MMGDCLAHPNIVLREARIGKTRVTLEERFGDDSFEVWSWSGTDGMSHLFRDYSKAVEEWRERVRELLDVDRVSELERS